MLYSFHGGTDGAYPSGGVIRDSAGNLYGVTSTGGASGLGTVFKLAPGDIETLLHSFGGGTDGKIPLGGLIRDANLNLYGTTTLGGRSGDGAVFKIDSTGKKTVLHSFKGGSDGQYPSAGLIQDTAGNLCGTTYGGGKFNWGTVFKIDSTGKESILYSFTAGSDGAAPVAGLVQDGAGNLYGTTKYGGAYGAGAVFELKIQ